MFFERSQTCLPQSEKLFGGVMRSGECVLAVLPNDAYGTAASNHGTWHMCAVTSTFRVVVEAKSDDTTASLSGGPSSSEDAFCFPCRNVSAMLQAHNIVATQTSNSGSVDLNNHVTWVSGAASVTSILANVHQKDTLRMSNAAHLPTIAGILETPGDKRRFLAVFTPYDPMFAASETELQLAAAQRDASQLAGDNVRYVKFFDRHPLSSTVRTFDVLSQNPHSTAYHMDDSEASSLLDAKHRPEGIAYTLSLCQVSAGSSMVAVGLDGAYIAVFQPCDLVEGTGGPLSLPLIVRPASPLEVVSLVHDAGMSGIRQAHRQLCWAAAVSTNARIVMGAECSSFCFATLLSDGTVRTFAVAHNGAETPALFSPAEAAESPSPRHYARAASEMVLHLVGMSSLQDTSTEPLGEGREGGDAVEIGANAVVRLSPNSGLICFALSTPEVVVVPLGHQQPMVRVAIQPSSACRSTSESSYVCDLLWLGDASKGLVVVTAVSEIAQRQLWWVGVTGAAHSVARRDFFIEPSGKFLDEVPSLSRQSSTFFDRVKGLLPSSAKTPSALSSIAPGRALIVLPQRRSNCTIQSLRLLFVDRALAQQGGTTGLYVLHVSPPPNLSTQLRGVLSAVTALRRRPCNALAGAIAALFFGCSNFVGAWGQLLTMLPKHDVPRLIACAEVACRSYIRCVRGVVPCDGNEGTFASVKLRVSSEDDGALHSICSRELQLLRSHVFAVLGGHGCISALLDCASTVVDSPLRGTADVSKIADMVLATICADAHLAALLVPSSVNAPIRHQTVAVMIAASSLDIKTVVSWKSAHDAQLALVQQKDDAAIEAARQAKTALPPRPADLRQLESLLVEFINAAKVVTPSLSSPGSDLTTAAQQFHNNRSFSQTFTPVVNTLGQEIDYLVPFLLVGYGSGACMEWLQSLENACGTLAQVQQGAASPTTKETIARVQSARSLLVSTADVLR